MPLRLTQWLAHRRAVPLLLAFGVLLALSTLQIGFFTDDYALLAYLEGAVPKRGSPLQLYDFARADPADIHALVTRGPFPWWTDPELKLRFFRPLSSALFAVDHALFGHAPLGYHVHAVLWYALFLAGAVSLFHLVAPRPLRSWSLLVFVLGAAHSEPVGWLSSRHLLVASVPALWGLVAHVAYREHGFRPGRWLAVAGLLLGLMGGEAALGVAVLWMSYEWLGAPESRAPRERLAEVAVPGGIVIAYLLAYKLGNFGSARNAAYFEPLSDPTRFAVAMLQRVPIMLGEMVFAVPSAFSVVFSPVPFVVVGAVAVVAALGLSYAAWSAVPANERRAVRWLGAGAVASLLISVGGFPGSRLLLVPSIGGSLVLGTILCYGWAKLQSRSGLLALRRAGWLALFVTHVVLAPLAFLASSHMLGKLGAQIAEIDASLDGVLPGPRLLPATRPHVFLIASDPLAGIYVGAARALRAPGTASGWSMLSMAHATHDIRRVDDRTIVIETDRPMLRGAYDAVFRDMARAPLHAGQRFELDEATVTVLTASEGYPSSIEVRFGAPLEDDRYRLLAWQDGRLAPLRVAVGQHVVIPWTPGPTGFF
jgi:hypothetical protein